MMMMMMTTLMKLVNSGATFPPGIDKFYQPNSGCAQFQKRGRGYIYIYTLLVSISYIHPVLVEYIYISNDSVDGCEILHHKKDG